MSFVYRYLDRHGTVRYVGIVLGASQASLRRRFYQHSCEGDFASWRCEYLDGLTRTDAEMLENHFISVYKSSVINKNQLTHGMLTVATIHPLTWKHYPPQAADSQSRVPTPREDLANQPLDLSKQCAFLEDTVFEMENELESVESKLYETDAAFADCLLSKIEVEETLYDLLDQLAFYHISFEWHDWNSEDE